MTGNSNSGGSLLAASLTGSILNGKHALRQEDQTNINSGYEHALKEMGSRFDVNNSVLNKKKFTDQYAHIMSTSKAKGARFVNKEIKLTLTPPMEFDNLSDQEKSETEGPGKCLDEKKPNSPEKETSFVEVGDFLELESSSNSMKSNDLQVLMSDSSNNSRRRSKKRLMKEQKVQFHQKDLNVDPRSEE
jgi:hypothetical protein